MQRPPQQSKCSGLLVWEQRGEGSAEPPSSTCYGVWRALSRAVDSTVDLHEHASTRVPPEHASHLTKLSCLGQAVYQHTTDASGKATSTPPPACLGLEFLMYAQQAAQQRQHRGGSLPLGAREAMHVPLHQQPQHQHQRKHHPEQQHVAANTTAADVDLLHTPVAELSTPSAADEGAAHDADASRRYPHNHHHTSSSGHGGHARLPYGPHRSADGAGRPSLAARLQQLHSEVSERLEGQDPWWFGKAFAARAEVNWAALKGVAGEVVAAALADLGIRQRPADEPPSSPEYRD